MENAHGSRDRSQNRRSSQADVDLVERFVTGYNSVEQGLRHFLKEDESKSFSSLVSLLSRRSSKWHNQVGFLKLVSDLRNVLVHDRTSAFDYPAVPSPGVVEELEKLAAQLTRPERVIPRFQRDVSTVAPDDSISAVLRLVDEQSYSQFPIYSNSSFKGLLTENGITRWLARHVTHELSLVDLEEVTVEQLVAEQEETEATWKFVSRELPTDELADLFARERLLEAVLITQHGAVTAGLLGIATRWDVIGLF
jgi:predicted transcriptional regulator